MIKKHYMQSKSGRLIEENLPRWAAEFGELVHGIWKNLPQKTGFPTYNILNWCFTLYSCCILY